MSFFFLLIFITKSLLQQEPCDRIKEKSEQLSNQFSNANINLNKPFYLSRKELFSIVYPEYVSFSATTNELELLLIKSNLLLHQKEFDLSFGPFQMKLSFIIDIINKTPLKKLNNPTFKKLRLNKNSIVSSDIDYLNRLEVQWEILRLFELSNYAIYKEYALLGLYTVYNRGDIKKARTIFHKINCKKMSYEDWCIEFLNYRHN
jgi:hypothetical protein